MFGGAAGEASEHQFVTDAMDGQEVLRLVGGVAKFLAELNDNLIEGARGAEVVVAPNFAEQAVAGEHLAWMRVQQPQQ